MARQRGGQAGGRPRACVAVPSSSSPATAIALVLGVLRESESQRAHRHRDDGLSPCSSPSGFRRLRADLLGALFRHPQAGPLATGYLADRGRRTLVADRGDLALTQCSAVRGGGASPAQSLVVRRSSLVFLRSGASSPGVLGQIVLKVAPTTRSTRSGARTCAELSRPARPSLIWGREERRDGIRALCGRWATTGWAAHWSRTHRPTGPISPATTYELAAAVRQREDAGSCHGQCRVSRRGSSGNGGRATIRVDRFGHAALVGLAFGP